MSVYVASCIGPNGKPIGAYKIGYSIDPVRRLSTLQGSLPFTLKMVAIVPGNFMMEKTLHWHLRDYRIGGEYFYDDPAVSVFVQAAKKTGIGISGIIDLSETEEIGDKAITKFAENYGLSMADVEALTGFPALKYEKRLDRPAYTMMKLVAAIALAARAKGFDVCWPLPK